MGVNEMSRTLIDQQTEKTSRMILNDSCVWELKTETKIISQTWRINGTHGSEWFAWYPVQSKSGEWMWLENVWRTRDDFLCRAPDGIIQYWKKS